MKRLLLLSVLLPLLLEPVKAQLQSDVSDSLWSIVMPLAASRDIDMGDVLLSEMTDKYFPDFMQNIGSWKFRVDSIYFRGNDASAFTLVAGFPKYEIFANDVHLAEFRFKPTKIGIHQAGIVIITQADTLYQNIIGNGVKPQLMILQKLIDFGKIEVGLFKDTLQAITIKNSGTAKLTIDYTKHSYPNYTDFTTLAGGGNISLDPGDTCKMDLRFMANDPGRTSGTLEFHYQGAGSPAVIQLFGEGVKQFPIIYPQSDPFPVVQCGISSVQNLNIKNTGTKQLIITNFDIQGSNFDEFSILESPPITIDTGKSRDFQINFIPKSVGVKTSFLEIISNADPDSILQIPLEGIKDSIDISFAEKVIDLGAILINEPTNKDITITNTGSVFNSGLITTSNSFIVNMKNISLNSGASGLINISYSGSGVPVEIDEIISITDSICKKVSNVRILLKVVSSLEAVIELPLIEGYPGDVIEVPVILNNKENIIYTGATGFKTDLSYNPTLLLPMDYPSQKINDFNSKITINNLPLKAIEGDTLAKINFMVGLGNAENCSLSLTNTESLGSNIIIRTIDGNFHLLGICEEGGTRLFNPNGKVSISAINPNPAKDEFEVKIHLIEEGITKLYLSNYLGNKIISIFESGISKAGEYSFNVSAKDLSSGLYFLVLETPTVRKVEKIVFDK